MLIPGLIIVNIILAAGTFITFLWGLDQKHDAAAFQRESRDTFSHANKIHSDNEKLREEVAGLHRLIAALQEDGWTYTQIARHLTCEDDQ